MPNNNPPTKAEKLLLDSFLDVLANKPGASKRFNDICDFLEGATQAAKALVKIRKEASDAPT